MHCNMSERLQTCWQIHKLFQFQMVLFVVKGWVLCVLFGAVGAKLCCKSPGLGCQFCFLEMLILVDQTDGSFLVACAPRSRLTHLGRCFRRLWFHTGRMGLTCRRLAVLPQRAMWTEGFKMQWTWSQGPGGMNSDVL